MEEAATQELDGHQVNKSKAQPAHPATATAFSCARDHSQEPAQELQSAKLHSQKVATL